MDSTSTLVLECLKKAEGRITAKEIAFRTGIAYNKVAIALTRISKTKEISRFWEKNSYQYWIERPVADAVPEVTEKPAAENLRPGPVVHVPTEPSGLDSVVRSLAKQLAVKVVGQLMLEVEQEIRQLLDQVVISGSPETKELVLKLPTQTETKRKPKVLIVGLLEDQRRMIDKEFGDCFDFKHIGAEGSPKTLQESLKHCAVAISMTGFVSHWIDDTIKKSVASDRFIRVSGGMSSLRQTLTDIFCKME